MAEEKKSENEFLGFMEILRGPLSKETRRILNEMTKEFERLKKGIDTAYEIYEKAVSCDEEFEQKTMTEDELKNLPVGTKVVLITSDAFQKKIDISGRIGTICGKDNKKPIDGYASYETIFDPDRFLGEDVFGPHVGFHNCNGKYDERKYWYTFLCPCDLEAGIDVITREFRGERVDDGSENFYSVYSIVPICILPVEIQKYLLGYEKEAIKEDIQIDKRSPKIGDKVKVRNDLLHGMQYGDVVYFKTMADGGVVLDVVDDYGNGIYKLSDGYLYHSDMFDILEP